MFPFLRSSWRDARAAPMASDSVRARDEEAAGRRELSKVSSSRRVPPSLAVAHVLRPCAGISGARARSNSLRGTLASLLKRRSAPTAWVRCSAASKVRLPLRFGVLPLRLARAYVMILGADPALEPRLQSWLGVCWRARCRIARARARPQAWLLGRGCLWHGLGGRDW